ncbi:AAA family ATPase [Colwellia psychrerythraea]|nr:AAA family ATPase [Colwellia psychrerythraea]
MLQAINTGKIAIDIAPQFQQNIALFDWNTLIPNKANTANSQAIFQGITNISTRKKQMLDAHRPQLLGIASQFGLTDRVEGDIWELAHLDKDELGELLLGTSHDKEQVFNQINSTTSAVVNNIIQSDGGLSKLAKLAPSQFLKLTEEDLFSHFLNFNGGSLFQQTFSEVFLRYHELVKLNKLKELDHKDGVKGVRYLSNEKFIETYGKPPWDFVNRLLEDAELDFEISKPEGYVTSTFSTVLTKKSSGNEVNFAQLSSGEKILMSFAFCIYNAKGSLNAPNQPKVLLFDEVDATLHPSMSKQLMKVIINTLVGELGIHVIMTTHSPSTVAVAPEEAVYLLNSGNLGLEKVNKRQAISSLTAEVPTLAISFDGRRQVFVESHLDAERYDLLYRTLSKILNSERSLIFMGVGRKKSDGREDNGGCDKVKAIVKSLRDGGNESVYGLLDWDTTNEPQERLYILGQGKRYAIENLLLDPLLLMSLLIRDNRGLYQNYGLISEVAHSQLVNLDNATLQEAVNKVQQKIIGKNVNLEDSIDVTYYGGIQLSISKSYLHMQGHELEGMVRAAFPELGRYNNSIKLLKAIIDPIMFESPEFIPLEIIKCFESLLND